MINDPHPQPFDEEALSEDGAFVVGLRRGADSIVVDPSGVSFAWDQEIGDIDLAARFGSEDDAANAASERGMSVFEVVEKAGAIELRAID